MCIVPPISAHNSQLSYSLLQETVATYNSPALLMAAWVFFRLGQCFFYFTPPCGHSRRERSRRESASGWNNSSTV